MASAGITAGKEMFGMARDAILLAPNEYAFVRYVIRRGELFAAEDRHGPDEIFWVRLGEPFMLEFQTREDAVRCAGRGDAVLEYVTFDEGAST